MMSRFIHASLRVVLASTVTFCSGGERSRAEHPLWSAHASVIDRQIAVLSGGRVTRPPTQEELVRTVEFFEKVTGVKARVTYTPMGPIAELGDLVEAKRRWEDWRVANGEIIEERISRAAEQQ